MHKISVLIPLHNGIRFLEESITSVLNQTYTNYEVIIGVNGFKKDSDVYKIASEYKSNKIKVLDLFFLKGKSNSLNYMIGQCKYDWVALLDVDDIWMPDKLEEQVKYMNYYDVIGTHCKYFEKLEVSPIIPMGDLKNFDFLSYNPIINSSCLIKKELAFWNNINDGVEDYELWLKLNKEGKKFFNINRILVKHRIHEDSAFNTTTHNDKLNRIKVFYGR